MRLTANQLAWLAVQAGWPEADRADAVAVALAESAGDPAAHAAGPRFRGHDYRGLWQVPIDLYPVLARVDLFHPGAAAHAAHALWLACGEQFSWAQSWTTGGFARFLGAAVAGLARPEPVQVMPELASPGPGDGMDVALAGAVRALVGRMGAAVDLPPRDHLTPRV